VSFDRSTHSDAPAPATAARTAASSTGQIQSPGYQPIRRRHRASRRATSPRSSGRCSPHSRQYS
jgi:hypothetical protein